MPFDWQTSAAINFTSNGVAIFSRLEKAAASLTATLGKLDAAIKSVNDSLAALDVTAAATADTLDDLLVSTRASSTASTRAATAARRQAAAYDMAGAAARAAAVETASYARAAAIGGVAGGGGRGGGGFLGGAMGRLPGPIGVAGRIGSVVNRLTGGSMGHLLEGGVAIDALYEAGHYQSTLQSIANITGADPRTMASIRAQSFDVGNMSGMSPTESAKMMREIARMSQGAMSVPAMQTLLPLMAKAQTVIGTTRGYSPEQTTDAMMSYVHLMRMYDPKKMPAGFDLATRMFELIPTAPKQTIRQLSYFVPQLKNLGVPDVQQDALMLTLARAGYGQGKGGTGLANLVMQSLGPLQITSFAQAQKAGLLKNLGMTNQKGVSEFFNDRAGGNIIGMLDSLAKARVALGALQATKLFQGVFGIQGARIADLLADPVVHQQIQGSVKALGSQKSIGLNEQFTAFMGTFDKQAQRSAQNFQAAMTELGRLTLPAATKAAKDAADALYNMTTWLRQNPKLEHEIAQGFIDTLTRIERYLSEHRADFAAIATNVGNLVGGIYELGKAASQAIGPLTTGARIFTDLVGFRYDDLGKLVSEARAANVATQIKSLGSHDARAKAWSAYVAQFGSDGVPANVLNALPKGGAKPAAAPHPAWAGGPMGATSLNVHVSVSGDIDPKSVKVAAHASQPRSLQNTAGATRPHPHLPLAVTVAPAR